MSKYEPLKRFLESIQPTVNVESLTFGEIEGVLGFKLPKSAYEHRAWWSNQTFPEDHPHAQFWLEAGWMVDSVDQLDTRVHFRRTTSKSTQKVDQSIGSTKHSYHPPKAVIEQNVGRSQPRKDLQLLLMLGFEEVGRWFLDGNSVQFRLAKSENERNILYAFVVQGNVQYIGKSTMTLSGRMNGYRNPDPTQTTNINNNARIRELLQKGTPVQIFALVPEEKILYKGFPVNIAAGLEDNLLIRIRPPWNDRI
jgi:hypothetical protein